MSGEPKFTTKQVAALLVSVASVCGAGGAITVKAQDAVQDQRLEQLEKQTAELRTQVLEGTKAATETRTTVKALEGDVDEIKADTKEIQRLLNRLIGGRQSE